MIARALTKANRRKREKRPPRFKLPTIRWRALLWMPLAVAALGVAVAGIGGMLDRPVRQVVVTGTFQRVTPIEIEAAVADALRGGFVSVDLRALRVRIENLDWVDAADVGRAWPDTITVRVSEHQAAARWGEHGLLNVRGELFTDNAQYAFPELPSLAGPVGSEREVATRYLAVRGPLIEAELTLESLTMDERGAWHVVLGGGQEIRLGRRDIDDRLRLFFAVVAPALANDLARVSYVDLRYTNGFAVGWQHDGALSDAGPRGTTPTSATADSATASGTTLSSTTVGSTRFRTFADIASAGTVARRDARAGASRDGFTAFPADAMSANVRNPTRRGGG
jgi:cell division protein FtsQ